MTFVFFDDSRFPVSKTLLMLEATVSIPNLETMSTKYFLKVFDNLISEELVTLCPKTDFTVFQNFSKSMTLPKSKLS